MTSLAGREMVSVVVAQSSEENAFGSVPHNTKEWKEIS